MSARPFFIQLFGLSLAASVGLFFLLRLPQWQAYQGFAWACLALFIAISVLMYFAGAKAARSSNKNDFTTVALGFSGGKIFLSAIAILVYVELAKPESKLFVLPFFFIYTVYTIFEVYFMIRLGRTKP